MRSPIVGWSLLRTFTNPCWIDYSSVNLENQQSLGHWDIDRKPAAFCRLCATSANAGKSKSDKYLCGKEIDTKRFIFIFTFIYTYIYIYVYIYIVIWGLLKTLKKTSSFKLKCLKFLTLFDQYTDGCFVVAQEKLIIISQIEKHLVKLGCKLGWSVPRLNGFMRFHPLGCKFVVFLSKDTSCLMFFARKNRAPT